MSDERRFPVLYLHPRARGKVPRDVPWSFVEGFRAQAESNHGQTLERLAERGGRVCPSCYHHHHARAVAQKRRKP